MKFILILLPQVTGLTLMKKHIPNLLTLLNLASGFISIIFILNGYILVSVWILIGALVFDFADGLAARLLNAYSELGKQLDSLADMVSFGVAPGLLMYNLILNASGAEGVVSYIIWTPLIIPVLSGLRLGIFNIDTEQTDSFRGLPTPANAMFIFSLILAGNYSESQMIESFISSRWVLAFFTIIFSILMVTRIPMFSFKIRSMKFKGNELRIVFIASCILLIAGAGVAALPLIIILYITVSITHSIIS